MKVSPLTLGFVLGIAALAGCTPKAPEITLRPKPLNLPKVFATEEAKRVLVVCNNRSDESMAITQYYCEKRGIAAPNVVQVATSLNEVISYTDFRWEIRDLVKKAIQKSKHRIDFIVVTKGVPLRIHDKWGPSVDGQLTSTLEDRKLIESGAEPPEGKARDSLANPYYNQSKPFNSETYKMHIVTRLDAYTVEEVYALIDRALAAKPSEAQIFFDQAGNRRSGGYGEMNEEMAFAAQSLRDAGKNAYCETSDRFGKPPHPVLGYMSWGSNDGAFRDSAYKAIRFVPGGLCETFVSFSGRSFLPQSSGQSMIADLISQGATGAKGYVSEPWLFAMAQPSILFERYLAGANLAESFSSASPTIMWKDVIIGDPLCRPFGEPNSE